MKIFILVLLLVSITQKIFGAVVASDTFTGDNGELAATHVADTGNTWTRTAGGTLNENIASNKIVSSVNTPYKMYTINGTGLTGDMVVQAYMTDQKTAGKQSQAIAVRVSSDGETYYIGRHDGSGWQIYERSGGGFTLLTPGYGSANCTITASRTMQLGIVGSNITLYCNGVSENTATDSTIASGSPGIGAFYSDTSNTLDDLQVYEYMGTASSGAIGKKNAIDRRKQQTREYILTQ